MVDKSLENALDPTGNGSQLKAMRSVATILINGQASMQLER